MGSGGSTLDVGKRIEEVEKACAGKKIGTGKEGLDDMKTCSEELKSAMDEVAAKSSPDLQLIDRIGMASDIIYSNIETRITLELVQQDDAADIRQAILDIAMNLDAVRATKVSPKVEAKWSEAEQHKFVQIYKELEALIKGISDIAKLPEALEGVNEKLQVMQGAKKELAEKTLALCSGFSSAKFQKGFPGLLQKEGPEILERVRAPVAQFDASAQKIASVAEGSWEELAPVVGKLTIQVGSHQVKVCLQQAAVELAQDHFDEGAAAMAQMQSWWRLSEGSDDQEALKESLGKVMAVAEERALASDKDLSDFAVKMDELCSGCGVELGPLATKLAEHRALGPLKQIQVELEKESDQNLEAMLSSLQEISETLAGAEGLEATLTALEDFLQKSSEGSKHQELPKVIEIAAAYDEIRPKLSLPESPPLLPRIKVLVTSSCLKRAQEELCKEHGLNAALVLDLVKHCGEVTEDPDAEMSTSAMLQEVVEKTCERMSQSFTSALSEGPEAKVQGLLKFAEAFDAACVAAGGNSQILDKLKEIQASVTSSTGDGGEGDPAETPGAVEDSPESTAAKKISQMEEMLSQETGMNPNVILKDLTELAELWPLSPELSERLSLQLVTLQERMAKACATASAEDQEPKLKALLGFAHKVHDLQQHMDNCAPDFLFAVCSAGALQDLTDAESELGKETGMNPVLVLKNIRNLQLYWQALGSRAEDLHQRLWEMCELMRSRITSSYEQNPEKRPNLLKFSAAFDAAIKGLNGAGEADLTERLKAMEG